MVKNIDELYRSYVVDVKRYLLSLTSNKDLTDDLLQETFLRAYLHIESCPIEYVKPWLFKIAYHLYMDYLRKHKPLKYVWQLTDYLKNKNKVFCSSILGISREPS